VREIEQRVAARAMMRGEARLGLAQFLHHRGLMEVSD